MLLEVSNITIGIVAYNEEKYLPEILNDILCQTYPISKIELILVDGVSNDNTLIIMNNFKRKNEDIFFKIKIISNKRRTQASGWNIVINNAQTDAIARIDAHSKIPPDFIEKNIQVLNEGEYISGGIRPCLIKNPTKWKKTMLAVENSIFGSSINKSRRETNKKQYVKTFFHAVYRIEVFRNVGFFNENLLRTEDNELHYRMRKKGYKFCLSPNIKSYQYARNNFREMLKQKFLNGYWISLTIPICIQCLSLFYFIPACFVIAILFSSILCMFNFPILLFVILSIYFFLTISISLLNLKNEKDIYFFIMPLLFFLLHFSYGLGTIYGCFQLIKKLLKHNYD